LNPPAAQEDLEWRIHDMLDGMIAALINTLEA